MSPFILWQDVVLAYFMSDEFMLFMKYAIYEIWFCIGLLLKNIIRNFKKKVEIGFCCGGESSAWLKWDILSIDTVERKYPNNFIMYIHTSPYMIYIILMTHTKITLYTEI